MFQRIVCFKFKDDVAEDGIRRHMADFAALKEAIPQIAAYSGGMVVENDEMPSHYDSMHYLTFCAQDDLDTYFHHAAHQQFVAAHKDKWANVLVLNATVEGA